MADLVQDILQAAERERQRQLYRADPGEYINRLSNPELPRFRKTRGSKTSTAKLDARGRMLRALQLRLAGFNYDEISKHLGYAGRQQSYKAVKTILDETLKEPADELRQLETAKIDALINVLWIDCLLGDLKAMDRIVRLLERKSKLLGLDAPVKVENLGLPPVVRIQNDAKDGIKK